MSSYVAFLRGINVGGQKKVPMAALRESLAALGFESVKTVLVSGNVAFTAQDTDAKRVGAALEKHLERTFGFPVPVILRTRAQIEALVRSSPFAEVRVRDDTRLYVTFLAAGTKRKGTSPPAPDGLRILRATSTEVCSVLTPSPRVGTPDVMKWLEQAFGKSITTRSWGTIEKIVAA